MDAFHIHLGHPWQYDRRTTHDGFANTYSFTYEGRRITLFLSQDSTPQVTPGKDPFTRHHGPTQQNRSLLTRAQCVEEMQEAELVVALGLSPTTATTDLEAPPVFTALLQEFGFEFSRVYSHDRCNKLFSM